MKSIITNVGKNIFNPFINSTGLRPLVHKTEFEEAVVVDVVINEDHPEYAMDGYNVGAAKVRLLRNNFFRSDEKLNWAFPMESNISEYPLIDELVIIYPLLDRMYYTRKLNVSNRPTDQRFFGLNKEMQPSIEGKRNLSNILKSVANPVKIKIGSSNNVKFKDLKNIYRLRHSEGDVIFEGRSGHSIRFGSSWLNDKHFISATKDQSPNLLLRIGPDEDALKSKPDSPYATVIEDINKDKSSIWMVSDQDVKIELSTKNTTIHGKSILDFPQKLDGNQIVINTDRYVLNTKIGKILLHSYDGLHLTSAKDVSIDVNRDYFSWISRDSKIDIIGNDQKNVDGSLINWAGKTIVLTSSSDMILTSGTTTTLKGVNSISLLAPKTYIGSMNNTSEPIPLGKALTDFLEAFLDAHIQGASSHVITSMGPGALNPGIIAKLQKLKADLASKKIISDDNFVNKSNQGIGTIPGKMNLHN